MSEIRALIEQLVSAGVDPVEAAEVVTRAAIHGAANTPKARSAGAIRQERYRRNKASQVTDSDDGQTTPDKETPHTPQEINPKNTPPSPPKGGSSPTDFDAFWEIYPNKVGKADARKKFAKAVRIASLDTIMAGLKRYVAKTDDRPWCNPATWLHQERWGDQPADVQPRGSPSRRPPSLADAMLALSEGLTNGQDGNRTGNESDWSDAAGFPRVIEYQR